MTLSTSMRFIGSFVAMSSKEKVISKSRNLARKRHYSVNVYYSNYTV